MKHSVKRIKELLIALNSQGPSMFQYPLGNVELTREIKELEIAGKIKFNKHYSRWEKV